MTSADLQNWPWITIEPYDDLGLVQQNHGRSSPKSANNPALTLQGLSWAASLVY